jgi:nitric oxide reductase activation protein
VEVPKKTTQTPPVKRGMATTKRDNASSNRPRKEKERSPKKIVNVNQSVIDRHQVDVEHPQSSSQVCNINETRTSENLDSLVLGNHEEPHGGTRDFHQLY